MIAVFHGKYSVSFDKYLIISNGLVGGRVPASDKAKASLIVWARSLVGIALNYKKVNFFKYEWI